VTAGKIALIVGASAVGVFVLLKLTAPAAAAPASRSTSNTDLINVGANALIGGLASFFSSSNVGRPISGAPSVGYEEGESFDDFYTGMFGPGSLDVAGG